MRRQIISLVGAQGMIISRASGAALDTLEARGFRILDVGQRCLLAVPHKDTSSAVAGRSIFLLVEKTP